MATSYKSVGDVDLYIKSLTKVIDKNLSTDTTKYTMLNSFIDAIIYRRHKLSTVLSACVANRQTHSLGIQYDIITQQIKSQFPSVETMFIRSRARIKMRIWFRCTSIWSVASEARMLSEQERTGIMLKLTEILEILEKSKYNETTKQLFNNLNLK